MGHKNLGILFYKKGFEMDQNLENFTYLDGI
jgi:hypothetical protein